MNRKVLSGVTGSIYHGKTTAVMGPSGSGTTVKEWEGKVRDRGGGVLRDKYDEIGQRVG